MTLLHLLSARIEPEPFDPGFPEFLIFGATTAIILLIYQIKKAVGKRRAAERAAKTPST